MKRFFCDKCGKCCEKLPALVIDPGLDDGTGKCKFYDSQTNLCTIYDQRPDICNVDKMYSAFASLMCSLYQGVANSNYEQIDNSLTSICDLFGRKLAFPDQNSFDTFILDDSLCMPTL